MGGYGSGRWQAGTSTTSDYPSLDIRRFRRDHLLHPGRRFNFSWKRDGRIIASIELKTEPGRLILNHRYGRPGGDWQSMEYPVFIDWTACTFGGQRAWFRCPASGCGRRVALLYFGRSGIFACRHCYRLSYESQHERMRDRAARRANKIRVRLGWEPGIFNGPGPKPKSMHTCTFDQLRKMHDDFVHVALVSMARELEKRGHRLGGQKTGSRNMLHQKD